MEALVESIQTITLKNYQRTAFAALRANPRYILGDAPGIGKTFPSIHAAAECSHGKPKLIVVPAYLMYQWRNQIWNYLHPSVEVYVMERSMAPVPADYTGWVIISYHTLTTAGVRKHPELLSMRWGAVVFDEAHRLRGRNSQWTKAAYKLRAEHIWMLTGTPLVNNPGDIWPLLRILKPSDYTSYWRFVGEWCVLEQNPWTTKVGGIKREREKEFYAMLEPMMLRRTFDDDIIKAEVNLDDPINHFVPVTLRPAVLKAHAKALRDWVIENPDLDMGKAISSGGALVIALRKLTVGILPDAPVDTAKLDTAVDILSDRLDGSHVVFTWFRETAHILFDRITAARPAFLVTVDIPAAERERRIEAWKQTPGAVIVATMASMQEGVNLQLAESVIFCEQHYLPATLDQAMARVRRFGQTRPVAVYYLYAQGTVDETVWRVMQGRHVNVQKALLEDLKLTALPIKAKIKG